MSDATEEEFQREVSKIRSLIVSAAIINFVLLMLCLATLGIDIGIIALSVQLILILPILCMAASIVCNLLTNNVTFMLQPLFYGVVTAYGCYALVFFIISGVSHGFTFSTEEFLAYGFGVGNLVLGVIMLGLHFTVDRVYTKVTAQAMPFAPLPGTAIKALVSLEVSEGTFRKFKDRIDMHEQVLVNGHYVGYLALPINYDRVRIVLEEQPRPYERDRRKGAITDGCGVLRCSHKYQDEPEAISYKQVEWCEVPLGSEYCDDGEGVTKKESC